MVRLLPAFLRSVCPLTRGRSETFRLRSLKLGSTFAAVALLSAAACPTSSDDDGCGQFVTFTLPFPSAVPALTSPDLQMSLSGGVRTFSWSRVVENVCSEKHVKAAWALDVFADKLPAGWKVEAGYLITALVGREVTLGEVTANGIRSYDGETEIGLKQAFEGQPGLFLLFLDVSFTSQGDLNADREVVQRLFHQMHMIATFHQAGTN